MKLADFEIGKSFFSSGGFEWRCTDKGTRTITAIMLDPDKDVSWFNGPPYAVNEVVFDEYDIDSCYLNEIEMIKNAVDEYDSSVHPGFSSKDMGKMMKVKIAGYKKYPRENLMKKDKVGKDGSILHPYSAKRKEDGWYIQLFEVFTCTYSEMHEDEFVALKVSSESDLRKRKESLS